MSTVKLALLSCAILAAAALPARGDILIQVDQSTQRMSVDVDGQHLYDWRVSTGRPGYDTPNGDFHPNRMDADHYSEEYDNAPMPHAIFFDLHGHAIHGSYDPVGHPAASHGCVRLDPDNAAKLFDLVKEEGMANTEIEISGDVTVALRNATPARQKRIASQQPHVKKADHGQDEAYRQPSSSGRSYYASQPQQYQRYNYQPYGYDPAPYQSYGYDPAPYQPAWRW
jgi:hypothetical protein